MWLAIIAQIGVILFLALAVVTPFPGNFIKKTIFYLYGVRYMILSKDTPKKYVRKNAFKPKEKAAGPHAMTSDPVKIRVVFVRHGESWWNAVFNRFGVSWPVRALTAFTYEAVLFRTSPNHSMIIDSPLSARGKKQADELADFVRKDAGHQVPHITDQSVVVTSNLRRAMETTLIGLGPRISTAREKIVVDSCLQEASRNIDALTFSTQPRAIAATPINGVAKTVMHHATFDPSLNTGQKPLSSNIQIRMDTFVEHLLAGVDASVDRTPALHPSSQPTGPLKEVIVVGHSLWFKTFFQRFLPVESNHISKKKKMQNCAMVAFDLIWDRNGSGEVSIDEKSIVPLFKDFAK